MILPTTYTSGLLLLLLSFFCFGLWVNTFKAAGPRWRFELYSIDFALGFAGLSVAAAFTLGTLGSDLAFSDRLLVAGRASQAFMTTSGFLFSVGNMLLLAGVGLIGVSGAFPISIGVALVISSVFAFSSTNAIWVLGGVALLSAAIVFDALACRIRESAQRRATSVAKPAGVTVPVGAGAQTATRAASSKTSKAPIKSARKRSAKGILVSVLSGVMLGFVYPIGERGMTGELTLGPYAGLLVFSVGVLLSTIVFDFYFLNIAIDGETLRPTAYLEGKAWQHFLGLAGGAVWAAGALTALLALGVPAQTGLLTAYKFLFPLGSVVLAFGCGALAWKEFKGAPSKALISLSWTAVLFVLGLSLLGMAVNI